MAGMKAVAVRRMKEAQPSVVDSWGIFCPGCAMLEAAGWIGADSFQELQFLPMNVALSEDQVTCHRCQQPLNEPADGIVAEAIATASTAAALNAHRDELIRKLRDNGLSLRRIGTIVGLSQAGVQRVLDRAAPR